MIRLIRALPAWFELGTVILVAFGFFIFRSVASLFMTGRPVRTSDDLIFLIIFELAGLALLLPFLHIRGWTLERLGLGSLTVRDGLAATGLAAIAFLAYAVVVTFAAVAMPDLLGAGPAPMAGRIALSQLALVCLVNPLFEEIFVSGYVIAVLDPRRSGWTGINVSVAIRLLYHLYQGPAGVLSAVPLGLIFAGWYARTGRLWPLVMAHAMFDFLPFTAYIGG